MSVVTQQNITQNFLAELTANAPKADFTPFEKIANALKYLEEKGIPNNKTEEYKYCNVEAIIRKDFKSLTGDFTLPSKDILNKYKADEAINLFVVNGKLDEKRSDLTGLPAGLTVSAIENVSVTNKDVFTKHFSAYANEQNDAFIAMNTAYAGSGLFLHVKRNAVIEKPVRIIFAEDAKSAVAINCRNLFVIEENAQLTISQIHINGENKGNIFSNHLTEIYAGPSSIVHHDVLQKGKENAFAVYTTQISQEGKSNYSINTFSFSGALVRNNLNIVVNGEFAETHLNGLTVSNGTSLTDHHTLVDHAKANCESNELYKGIASGKSILTFNGKIFVRRDSQKINAYQSSKNILLSDDATVNTKPQLEIFANDVKCSHGTSTGKVDEDAMFYLKSRGIGEENARKLLLHAFAGEVIEKVKNEALRNELEHELEQALAAL